MTTTPPPGHLGNLSQEQQERLTELKARVKDLSYPEKGDDPAKFNFSLEDDVTLLKFLRARDFHLEQAYEMLKHHCEWREKWRPSEIKATDEDIAAGLKTGVWKVLGKTPQGVTIQMVDVSKFHPTKETSLESFCRNIIFHRETVMRLMRRSKWSVETTISILDMSNFSLLSHASPEGMGFIRVMTDLNKSHYPEILELAVLYNAPYIFRGIYSVVSLWLEEKTRRRILFASNAKQLAARADVLDLSLIPERIGGTRKDAESDIPVFGVPLEEVGEVNGKGA